MARSILGAPTTRRMSHDTNNETFYRGADAQSSVFQRRNVIADTFTSCNCG